MHKVVFRFEEGGETAIYAGEGENLLEAARKANVAIDAPCSGNLSCGKCRVRILSGEVMSEKDRHITKEEYAGGWRLACGSRIVSDCVVEVPDIASAFRSRMKVADLGSEEEVAIFKGTQALLKRAGISMGNGFREAELALDAPTVDDTMPDNERLKRKAADALGAERVTLSFPVLKKLARTLRDHDFRVKCAAELRDGGAHILDITGAEDTQPLCGLAIDIGTTSVTGVLCDLKTGGILAKASAGNGQIRYGADVINRIIESVKPGGAQMLQKAVVEETLCPMINSMKRAANVDGSRIVTVTVAGNTTMNHLLLGVYADPVRMEPFVPTFFDAERISAGDIGLPVCPCASVTIAPNIGSYVGGDITAGALSSLIWAEDALCVFIDLGTNGEIVLGNNEFLLSCACSAGPAFEGGDIGCGMRATDGAIEACTIDRETMTPCYTVVGGAAPAGVCGSGIIDLIAELFRCGVIDSRGKFVREGERVRRDEVGMGSYVVAFGNESGTGRDIVLTEVDIDNFIRAKGAIFSAIRVMLESTGMDIAMVERVMIAGGIGSGINIENAIRIGMLPDIPKERYAYIGNSALSGAYAMTVSAAAREKVAEIAAGMTYIELSNEPAYMDEFVAACFIPHTDSSLFPSAEG